jgi:hypothetical protein
MTAGLFGLGGPEMIALLFGGLCFAGVMAGVLVMIISLTGKNAKRLAALEEENRRLREENEHLRSDRK